MSVLERTKEQEATEAPSSESRWLGPLVWTVIAAIILLVIVLSWKPADGPGYLYDSSKKHNWLVSAIFQPTSVGQKFFVMLFAIALFLAVMSLILWLVDRPRVPKSVLLAGFLGPVVIALTAGLLWSGIKTIVQSFQKFDQFGTQTGWAGFDNYGKIFTSQNAPLLINSVLWIFLVPLAATSFGLLYALLVDRTRYENLAKALIFTPTAISMVAASVIWKYVYFNPAPSGSSQVGLLNAAIVGVGGTPQNFITKFPLGTFALILVMVWIQAGFAMTVLSAALKAVPDDIIEAAKIDGASGRRMFFSITLPSIRPTVVVVLTTVAIASLKTFDIVNVMGGNLPKNNILANAFYNALSVQQIGQAGAFAVIIFVVVTPVIIFNVIQMKKSEADR